MTWITNHPKPLKGMWPRRVGCEYVEGEPKSTEKYDIEFLKAQNLIGVYVDLPPDEYYKLPVARNPQEFAALS